MGKRSPTVGQGGWITDNHEFFEFLRDTPVPRAVLWRQLKTDFSAWKPLAMVLVGVTALALGVMRWNPALSMPGLWLLLAYAIMLRKMTRQLRTAPIRHGFVRKAGKPHPYMQHRFLTHCTVDDGSVVPVVVEAKDLPELLAHRRLIEVAFLDPSVDPAPYGLVVAHRPVEDLG